MSLTIAIIFILAGLGITGGSTFEFIRAPDAQNQMIPVGTMIVGAILLMGGGIALSIWATARKQIALLSKGTDPTGAALLEGIGKLQATAKKGNDLLEKILQGAGSGASASAKAAASAPANYFYADSQMKPHGPVTGPNLKEMLANGLISKETPVAAAGSDKWLPYSSFPELG